MSQSKLARQLNEALKLTVEKISKQVLLEQDYILVSFVTSIPVETDEPDLNVVIDWEKSEIEAGSYNLPCHLLAIVNCTKVFVIDCVFVWDEDDGLEVLTDIVLCSSRRKVSIEYIVRQAKESTRKVFEADSAQEVFEGGRNTIPLIDWLIA